MRIIACAHTICILTHIEKHTNTHKKSLHIDLHTHANKLLYRCMYVADAHTHKKNLTH